MTRVVTFDIETMANKSWHWRLWQENIGPSQLIQPTYMLSYAYKINNRKTVYRCADDPDFLDTLYRVITGADLLVTYNGDKFDMMHVRREFLEAGYPPLRPVPTVDLYKVVKSTFKFPSNRLDYVASVVLGERKLETGGFDLWKSWEDGCPRAKRLMERYNKRDVNVTQRLYRRLRPWIKNHPHIGPEVGIEDSKEEYECPACGSHKTDRRRERRTRCFAIRQCQYGSCGHWFDGKRQKL